ncbi:imidazole glycerol phosphate synthase subunit HisH [Polynucleobacter paneuropaeus]|uniref:imidazole glycerol phosphate synthase subunit HisH n=1 Tax=Polynucleobacter paneuropaeus TaxID=2527775 RepID=UPI001BFCE8D2|nr:imidazole glycerol phosphate synthase subunit HisH [Polynucleobacter paneuropaeus]MBT8633199.1 imidazole glycerol phosphate synthase subunit HisH [Polynucleobacter paneuropaeus]
MSCITVGIVDYGMGNHASVIHSLRALGFRTKVSSDPAVLDNVDILLIPGVGAFPAAMQALHQRGLVGYLQLQACKQRPIIGICLGMQLLASGSYEFEYTAGLDIIPGKVVAVGAGKWHIGWNTVECHAPDSPLQLSDGEAFYFNHSFCFRGPAEYQIGSSRYPDPFASVIQRGSVVGLQFHPEKSQEAGRILLKNIITELAAYD